MQKNSLSIPVAILIAGAMIAGAVLFSNSNGQLAAVGGVQEDPHVVTAADITESDHILGDKNSSIKIVEYSDIECPFCKQFHTTLHEIIEGENKIENVAWVYRHYPIERHTTATREAEATECVAKIAGEGAFWTYLDSLYETTESNDGLPDEQLFILGEKVGVSTEDLTQCLDSGEMSQKIADAVVAAGEAGARGTPYNVVFLDYELSNEQIITLKEFDLQITQGHPTNRVFRVDEVSKNKFSMSGAIPRDIIDVVFEIIEKE